MESSGMSVKHVCAPGTYITHLLPGLALRGIEAQWNRQFLDVLN